MDSSVKMLRAAVEEGDIAIKLAVKPNQLLNILSKTHSVINELERRPR
jgi:hypothetical protein